jgi:hypothetical protein
MAFIGALMGEFMRELMGLSYINDKGWLGSRAGQEDFIQKTGHIFAGFPPSPLLLSSAFK